MTTIQNYSAEMLHGKTVYASDGEKLGKVDDVLVDEAGAPVYIETKKGLFSGRRHIVPIDGMMPHDDDLTVAWTREQLENAPQYGDQDEIDEDRERELGNHYGTGWHDRGRDSLGGEDLSEGPTPETRHPAGGVDDVHDTTEGPTPDTRAADRAAEGRGGAASGQPAADARTRGDVGGNQVTGQRTARDRDARTRDQVGDMQDTGQRTAPDPNDGDSIARSGEEPGSAPTAQRADAYASARWVETREIR